jgi:serine/threonine protein kinase
MATESPAEWMLAGIGPGSVVAGYRVESRIGHGGMAVVLRARDEALGRLVALKVLAPTLASDAGFRERFIRESRAAATVDHPHIIPVYAAGEAGEVLYIAMRYVPGGDLRGLLHREGPLPAGRAGSLLHRVASALDAGHAAGLVHRDVKPGNILIDASFGRDDHPYLADFGLAKASAATTGLTGSGHFLGTLDYCAPEQISGKGAVPQTDQYALGCVAYVMLTGSVPFPREEATAILWAHMSEAPPSLTALRPDLPPAVDQVVAKALAKAPEDRYATCGEFSSALRAAFGTQDLPGLPGTRPRPNGTPRQPGEPSAAPSAAVLDSPDLPPAPWSTPPHPAAVTQSSQFTSPTADLTVLRSGDGGGQGPDGGTAPTRPATRSAQSPGSAPFPPPPSLSRTRRRAGVAAAVVVIAGGATATALLIPSAPQTSPSVYAYSAKLIATVTDPSSGYLAGVALQTDQSVVITDAQNDGYAWNLASGSPHPEAMDYTAASILVSAASAESADGTLRAVIGPQPDVVDVKDAAGKVVVSVSTPGGNYVNYVALSRDGTELAVAAGYGEAYVWKLSPTSS